MINVFQKSLPNGIFDAKDSDLFRTIVIALMSNDSGVNSIDAKPYRLIIDLSPAVSVKDLAARIKAACKRAGKVPSLRLESPFG